MGACAVWRALGGRTAGCRSWPVENGARHQLRYIFEKVADVAQPAIIGNRLEQNLAQLPVAGCIDTYLDGELANGNIGGIQLTPWGMVTHQKPVTPMT